MATYKIGCEVRLEGKFYNRAGALADPSAVTLKVKGPSQTTTYTTSNGIVCDSTGCYHYDLALTASGQWYYRWIGTGTVVAADENFFNVQTSAFK